MTGLDSVGQYKAQEAILGLKFIEMFRHILLLNSLNVLLPTP